MPGKRYACPSAKLPPTTALPHPRTPPIMNMSRNGTESPRPDRAAGLPRTVRPRAVAPRRRARDIDRFAGRPLESAETARQPRAAASATH